MYKVNKVDYLELIELIEDEQKIQVRMSVNSNNINILPVVDEIIGKKFLQITFRIENNTLVIAWLYLLYESTGTGTKIMKFLINYCKIK